jgi:hypothetical protein
LAEDCLSVGHKVLSMGHKVYQDLAMLSS